MLSVVTVSKREGWLDIARESLLRQEMSLEWIIVQEGITKAEEYTSHIKGVNDTEIVIRYLAAPPKITLSNLNRSLNHGLRNVSPDTKFVIFYQDFIVLQDDCFKKLLEHASEAMFVGTITKNTADEPDDPRYMGVDCVRPCLPCEWETNVALAPMKAVRELGGFDEDYDNGWAWDNVNLAERAELLGYTFCLDETNRPQLLYHVKERSMKPNGEFHAQRMREIKEGTRKIHCGCL